MFSTHPFAGKTVPDKQHRSRRHRLLTRRLAMEECESRQLLAVFTVTSPLDTGAPGELRWAVNSANTTPDADLIRFANSVHQINLTQGELAITDAVSIGGLAADVAPVEITASTNSRIFRVDDSNPATRLEVNLTNLRLTEGNVAALSGQGGAVLNMERLELRRSFVVDNRAATGGGIANHGVLIVGASQISDNVAEGAGGGGIWNGPNGWTTVNGGVVRGNATPLGVGGGVLNDGGTLTVLAGALVAQNFASSGGGVAQIDQAVGRIEDSVLAGNSAAIDGGGVFVVEASNVDLSGVEIANNRAGSNGLSLGRGGGLFASSRASVTVSSSAIVSNGTALPNALVTSGGGIFVGSAVALSVQNSRVSGNSATNGGGVFASSTSEVGSSIRTEISLSDTAVDNNIATRAGGGMWVGSLVDLDLKCVTVSGNSSQTEGGGLRLVGGPMAGRLVASLRDSVVSGNVADEVGGGISSVNGVELTLTNSIVSNNQAQRKGGGLHLLGTGISADSINQTSIGLSLISGNQVTGPGSATDPSPAGGGLWAGPGSIVEINASTIENNQSTGLGGGAAVDRARSFRLQNSTVSGNVASNGAGASVDDADATFLQTTFYANRARRNGGGLFLQSQLPEAVHIVHSTISLNSAAGMGAGRGGGIYVSGSSGDQVTARLDHTIVSGNLGAPLGGFDEIFDGGASSAGGLLSARYSLIRDNSGTSLPPGNPDPRGNLIGTVTQPIDAQLGPLGNAGGPTLTMVPSDDSPVINAGDPLFVGPPQGDQRLLPFRRVAFGRIDMGSIEVQRPPADPDFNDDGVADCHDIDALVSAIVAAAHTPHFDLTGDGLVDQADLVKWLDDAPDVNGLAITRYLFGDANLDTVVDISDFNLWNENKFTHAAAWCRGDFNADGRVDASDFNIWNENKFTYSPRRSGCGLFPELGSPSPATPTRGTEESGPVMATVAVFSDDALESRDHGFQKRLRGVRQDESEIPMDSPSEMWLPDIVLAAWDGQALD